MSILHPSYAYALLSVMAAVVRTRQHWIQGNIGRDYGSLATQVDGEHR